MEKIAIFRKTIKEKKYDLLAAGYSMSTIHSWMYTDRLPKFDTAAEISSIIGMRISDIPYYQIQRG
jgi:hypothetical protein